MTTATLPAPVRRAAVKATMELPFRLPAKEWFSIQEAARLSGVGETLIEKKFDEGRVLSGHAHNAGRGERMTKRIPRAWLITYLVSTALYDDEMLVEAMLGAVRDFPPPLRRKFTESVIRL